MMFLATRNACAKALRLKFEPQASTPPLISQDLGTSRQGDVPAGVEKEGAALLTLSP
jgi:hypothetical protein